MALYVGDATVDRIKRWIDGAGIQSGPLFRRVRKGNRVGSCALTPQAVRTLIRNRAKAVDVNSATGHSLRVGAAQSLAAAGASVIDMQLAGRWQSPRMPAHYARGQLTKKGAVARLRYGE